MGAPGRTMVRDPAIPLTGKVEVPLVCAMAKTAVLLGLLSLASVTATVFFEEKFDDGALRKHSQLPPPGRSRAAPAAVSRAATTCCTPAAGRPRSHRLRSGRGCARLDGMCFH